MTNKNLMLAFSSALCIGFGISKLMALDLHTVQYTITWNIALPFAFGGPAAMIAATVNYYVRRRTYVMLLQLREIYHAKGENALMSARRAINNADLNDTINMYDPLPHET